MFWWDRSDVAEGEAERGRIALLHAGFQEVGGLEEGGAGASRAQAGGEVEAQARRLLRLVGRSAMRHLVRCRDLDRCVRHARAMGGSQGS